jgi:hypothetical protein
MTGRGPGGVSTSDGHGFDECGLAGSPRAGAGSAQPYDDPEDDDWDDEDPDDEDEDEDDEDEDDEEPEWYVDVHGRLDLSPTGSLHWPCT